MFTMDSDYSCPHLSLPPPNHILSSTVKLLLLLFLKPSEFSTKWAWEVAHWASACRGWEITVVGSQAPQKDKNVSK